MQTHANAIDFDYLQTMNIKLLKGRFFDENRASDTINSVIINETLAKEFNIYDDPIGKKIKPGFNDENNVPKILTVVGMVKDYHTNGFDSKIVPTIMIHWNTFGWMKQNFWWMQFKIKPNNVQETLKYIENYWKEEYRARISF